MTLLGKEEETRVSIIKDPFTKEKITSFSMNMNTSCSGNKYFYGNVKFKNGNTEGSQRTQDHETFESLYLEMKQIFESIS